MYDTDMWNVKLVHPVSSLEFLLSTEAATGGVLQRKVLLKFRKTPQACNFIKKETLARVFSCEFCKKILNTFFYRTPMLTASVSWLFSSFEIEIKHF